MTLMCKIKKILNIQSPAPYEYCKLNLNASNKKRCKNCKHFKVSQYYAYEVGRRFTTTMQEAVESMNKFGESLKNLTRGR